MSRRGGLALLVAFVGCGGDGAGPTPSASVAAAPPSASVSARASAAASATSSASAGTKAVAGALTEGRKLAKDGKWAEAVEAFKKGAEVDPPSPLLLSELGWAAFNAQDLELAASATQRGLDAVTDPKVKASILYNKGRIAEAKGDKDVAKAAYEASIALRPSDVVKKRLEGLGVSAPAAPEPVKEEKPICAQSFPTIAGACACLVGQAKTLGFAGAAPSCTAVELTQPDGSPNEHPIEVVKLEAEGQSIHYLLLDVGGRLVPVRRIEGDDVVPRRVLLPLKGDASVLGLVFERTSTETGKTVRSTLEILCALPPHAPAPVCPLEVPNAFSEIKNGQADPERTATFVRKVQPDGGVVVKKQGGPDDLVLKKLEGPLKLF